MMMIKKVNKMFHTNKQTIYFFGFYLSNIIKFNVKKKKKILKKKRPNK